MANNNVVVVYDQLQSAVTKLENYYTLLEEQQKMISRLDTYFDHLYKIHGTNTTFVATMEDKIQNMALAVKNDMADIDYLKNLINYIIQSYTDAEGKTTLRSNELLLTALGSLVPATTGLTTNIYNNMTEYANAIQIDPTKTGEHMLIQMLLQLMLGMLFTIILQSLEKNIHIRFQKLDLR